MWKADYLEYLCEYLLSISSFTCEHDIIPNGHLGKLTDEWQYKPMCARIVLFFTYLETKYVFSRKMTI